MSELNAYKGKLDRMRRDAVADSWKINGVEHSRTDIMFKVVDWVSEGNTLKMFCEQAGAPSVGTVYRWFKAYPDFEKDFRAAEEAAAHIMSDRALLEVIHLEDKDSVPVVKLRYDALTRRAAQMNQRFQDKQVFRAEQDVKGLTDDELMKKRDELFTKVKDELRTEGWQAPEEKPSEMIIDAEEETDDE